MGSRKDILKNLGIPEYPWSSDDDEPPPDPRPATQPRSTTGQQPTPAKSSLGTSGRSQVPSRELFMSLLSHTSPRNGAATAASASTSSRPDLPLAYMPRTNHTPAPDMLVRVGDRDDRDDSDIRRVLAFKRLTRNMALAHGNTPFSRYPRYSGYTIPRSNTRPGSVVPSESNSCFGVRLPQWRRAARNSDNNNIAGSARQNHTQPDSSNLRRRRTQSMEAQNSVEEEPIVQTTSPPLPPSLPAVTEPAPMFDDPPAENETEAEAQASSNNTSGTGVSLEEEIVEIADDSTVADADISRAVVPSSSDPNLASTSRPDEVDAPEVENQLQVNQGVKRKRRTSSDEKPNDPITVKEFNQSLLRLLECPVCLEWMEPPMSQCRRGHLVCNRCRARLASCPVCRTTFSSVRNRAMEGVAEMLRYPCRHGCGREVRLRRRTPHEASCPSRKYTCPAPLCADKQPLPRDQLSRHFHSKHMQLLKMGPRHRFGIKVNNEAHDNWLILAMDEFFHMKVDVDIRTWGVIVYIAYIGPKCKAKDFLYEVTIDGQHSGRKMIYRRATHSDLESSSLNVSRQDCFHLTLDQALNFIRFKNRHCDAERFLEFNVVVSKIEPAPSQNDSDS